MFSENLLFESIVPALTYKPILTKNKRYVYNSRSEQFDLTEIRNIIVFLKAIKKRHKLSLLPIDIELGNRKFIDKLSYILLECLCYYLLKEEKCSLNLHYTCQHTIFNEGIKTSYLNRINSPRGKIDFVKRFRFDILRSHYRRVIPCEDPSGEWTSYINQDIDSFLKTYNIQKEYRECASNVICELVDNALEHSMSDCLVDIDITNDYTKDIDPNEENLYCGLNIVIINFSEILMGNGISQKISFIEKNGLETPPRYKDVLLAKEYHQNFWGKNYTKEDFDIVTSFQNKISSRETCSTGGTGLTQLIKALEEETDAYNCYMISGNRMINFIKQYLHSPNGWIGFNESNEYLNDIPSTECVRKSQLYFPGTAYNLNLVLKKEQSSYGTAD